MSTPASTPWLLRFKTPNAPRMRVLFVSPAGGAPGSFRPLALQLPDDVDAVSLVLPGRWSRSKEPAYRRMEPLIADVAPLLADLFHDVPLVLFGHSLGALIAFELACRWRETGAVQVQRLLVAARRAPHLPLTLPPTASLSDAAFIDAVDHRYGGFPKVVRDDPELLALTLPPLRADMEIYESYVFQPRAPLAIPIEVFGGAQDATVGRAELEPWSAHTSATTSVTLCQGGHFFLTPPPAAVLDALRTALA